MKLSLGDVLQLGVLRVLLCEIKLDLLWTCTLLEVSKVEKRMRRSEICLVVDENALRLHRMIDYIESVNDKVAYQERGNMIGI